MVFLKIILLLNSSLYALQLTYLPRNEDVEIVSATSVEVLSESSCEGVDDLIRKAKLCQECILLKAKCPDCCLATPSPGRNFEAIRCAPKDDPYGTDPSLKCNSISRFNSSCAEANFSTADIGIFTNRSTNAIPYRQKKGCPGIIPDLGTDPVIPAFKGCGSYFTEFEGDYFYRARDSSGKVAYSPTTEYDEFVTDCWNDANARESCAKKALTCTWNVCKCASAGCTGYPEHCEDIACKSRVTNWEKKNKTILTVDAGLRECYQLQTSDCLKFNKAVRSCLNSIESACYTCFKKIYTDDEFMYRFVARSGHKLVFLWKLYATSVGQSSQNAYFYSKIQVEDSLGNPVYSSPVHQKVFEGGFSIFSAIAVPSSVLHTGEEYYARLYYFISRDPDLILKMQINGAEITAIKVRE